MINGLKIYIQRISSLFLQIFVCGPFSFLRKDSPSFYFNAFFLLLLLLHSLSAKASVVGLYTYFFSTQFYSFNFLNTATLFLYIFFSRFRFLPFALAHGCCLLVINLISLLSLLFFLLIRFANDFFVNKSLGIKGVVLKGFEECDVICLRI